MNMKVRIKELVLANNLDYVGFAACGTIAE